jgi:CDP-diacylglycerol---serine O-phosphatidyltransferase
VKQASRIFVLPNAMTAGNLFCGFWAVINCIQARLAETAVDQLYRGVSAADHYRYAVYLIFFAAVFDMFDGRLARMGGRESLFGAEFDSLADVVSFGVAPALMMFFLILSPSQAPNFDWFRNIGWFIGFVYLLCAAMRLARFNVITNPLLRRGQKESNKDFVGLPVPAAAGTVASVVLFLLELAEDNKTLDRFALVLPFVMLLIAFLMMSTVRYPSGKTFNLQTRAKVRTVLIAIIFVGFGIALKEIALVTLTMGYVLYGILRHVRRSASIRRAAPAASSTP